MEKVFFARSNNEKIMSTSMTAEKANIMDFFDLGL